LFKQTGPLLLTAKETPDSDANRIAGGRALAQYPLKVATGSAESAANRSRRPDVRKDGIEFPIVHLRGALRMTAFEYGLHKTSSDIRAFLWRLGRKLYCFSRGELPNNPETNGEYWLLNQFLVRDGGELVVLDVGANIGDWTVHALEAAARGGAKLSVHAFEPCTGTRVLLAERLSKYDSVMINACALSSTVGESDFYSDVAGSGTNSLSGISGANRELVRMKTLDAFVAETGIQHVTMLKIDTEGFDFEVLKGSERTLSAGAVELVQFEYNWRWLINHASLRDVFEYIKDKPYRFGKLVGESIDIYDEWHFEMDRYFENNYVLIREGCGLLKYANLVRFDETNCARRIGACLNE
jgi:FkbM family methyltransferase